MSKFNGKFQVTDLREHRDKAERGVDQGREVGVGMVGGEMQTPSLKNNKKRERGEKRRISEKTTQDKYYTLTHTKNSNHMCPKLLRTKAGEKRHLKGI